MNWSNFLLKTFVFFGNFLLHLQSYLIKELVELKDWVSILGDKEFWLNDLTFLFYICSVCSSPTVMTEVSKSDEEEAMDCSNQPTAASTNSLKAVENIPNKG